MKGYAITKCSSIVVQLSCSRRIGWICLQLPLESLCFSAPLCESWLCLFLTRCSKLKNLTTKWRSATQVWGVKQKNHSLLANWTDLALSSHYLLWLDGSLSVHLFLDCTAPFGRPSASLEFLYSLISPHYACCISACCCPKHNSIRRSLSMLVLSHSDTHYLDRHMA